MVANCYNNCNNLQPIFVCCVKTALFNKIVIYTQRDGNSQIKKKMHYYNWLHLAPNVTSCSNATAFICRVTTALV